MNKILVELTELTTALLNHRVDMSRCTMAKAKTTESANIFSTAATRKG